MTYTITILSNGKPVTTLELFDDVYQRMQIEAALRDIPVEEHIISILAQHTQQIFEDLT